jgi:hypothetical protein
MNGGLLGTGIGMILEVLTTGNIKGFLLKPYMDHQDRSTSGRREVCFIDRRAYRSRPEQGETGSSRQKRIYGIMSPELMPW